MAKPPIVAAIKTAITDMMVGAFCPRIEMAYNRRPKNYRD